MRIIIILLIAIVSLPLVAQDVEEKKSKKGTIYSYWGWNRGWYSNSDIHFRGTNYGFKLNDVEATDRQSPFDLSTYFSPSTLTIPQTNFRLGYFINENLDISFGVDHMKYVMVANQQTEITGKINDETVYDGTCVADDFLIAKDFLEYEHTDGLNYLNFELTYNQNLLDVFKMKSYSNKFELDYLVGFGAGAMLPKSNVTLWNNERHDDFHLAGYGFAAKAGLNLSFFRFFYVRSEYKAGFTHLSDVRTSHSEIDRARQHFLFTQLNFMVGFAVNPFN